MHICQYKTVVNGTLVCSKYGHPIKTVGCPYCPARPYSGTSQRKPLDSNKAT